MSTHQGDLVTFDLYRAHALTYGDSRFVSYDAARVSGTDEELYDAADVDECAVRLNRLDDTSHHVAHAEPLAADDVGGEPVGHDEAVLLLVNFKELDGDGLADEILAVGHANRDVGLRDEASEVLDLDEEAAAVDGEDDGVDGCVVVLQLAAPVPRGFELLGWVVGGWVWTVSVKFGIPFSGFRVVLRELLREAKLGGWTLT